ncbi:MAG: lipase maturation factor family protein, partial [Planctomycetota bacterium]|nr:lipase maturation factor family protein [Planctomycetota bacterium]
DLLEHNPFPGAPPRYMRAIIYDYAFTDPAERSATGNWWKRTLLGRWSPVLERPDFGDGR